MTGDERGNSARFGSESGIELENLTEVEEAQPDTAHVEHSKLSDTVVCADGQLTDRGDACPETDPSTSSLLESDDSTVSTPVHSRDAGPLSGFSHSLLKSSDDSTTSYPDSADLADPVAENTASTQNDHSKLVTSSITTPNLTGKNSLLDSIASDDSGADLPGINEFETSDPESDLESSALDSDDVQLSLPTSETVVAEESSAGPDSALSDSNRKQRNLGSGSRRLLRRMLESGGDYHTFTRDGKRSSVPGSGGDFAGFTIIERIAEGGMGVIFKARQAGLNRLVAVKVLKQHKVSSPNARIRFIREAEAAASLRHENIVPIHEISEIDGFAYYVMDFVHGLPLNVALKKRHSSYAEIAQIMASVAGAVQHFHTRGIIHRDLKPDNILVRNEDGTPIIIDFGVAKTTSASSRHLTQDGAVLGTPHFMAPEQARGLHNEVDTRSDIYALGTILYQLLTGHLPFESVDPKVLLYTLLSEEPKPPNRIKPGIPWELSAIAMKAMEKEPEARYQSAHELREDLLRFVNNEPIVAENASYSYRVSKFVTRHRQFLLTSLLVLTIICRITYYGVNERFALVQEQVRSARIEASKERKAKLFRERQLRAEQEARRSEQEAANAAKKLADALQTQRELERKAKEAEQRQRTYLVSQQLEKARQLLLKHRRQKPLVAINSLQEALTLIGSEDPALRDEVGRAKFRQVVVLAREALDKRQPGMAEYWLSVGQMLQVVQEDPKLQSQFRALQLELGEMRSGAGYFAAAQHAYERNDLVAAAHNLKRAREAGVESIEVADLELLVDKARQSLVTQQLQKSREALQREDYLSALTFSQQSLKVIPDSKAARNLKNLICKEMVRAATVFAIKSSLEGLESQGIRKLQDCEKHLDDPHMICHLTRQIEQRKFKQAHRILDDFVYIPPLTELENHGFLICKFEVTREQFRVFTLKRGYTHPKYWDNEFSPFRRSAKQWRRLVQDASKTNPGFPVRDISFYEAQAFCRWLSEQYKIKFRLPTEEEWMIAAGWSFTERKYQKYPGADNFDSKLYAGPNAVPLKVSSEKLDLSPWGLRGVGHNVREWVTAGTGKSMVTGVKGSDYLTSTLQAQSAAKIDAISRPGNLPIKEVATRLGFRLVCEPEPGPMTDDHPKVTRGTKTHNKDQSEKPADAPEPPK